MARNLVNTLDLSSLFSTEHSAKGATKEHILEIVNQDFLGKLFYLGTAQCLFLRTWKKIGLTLHGSFRIENCPAGGWLLLSLEKDGCSYWLPAPLMLRKFDKDGHITEESNETFNDLRIEVGQINVSLPDVNHGWDLESVIWKISELELISDLQTLTREESRGYFLLGSHTVYKKPADIYCHMAYGLVYENRFSWPYKYRIFSENDAHALHLIFSGLQLSTGKKIYSLLKKKLVLSVLSRQGTDGAYRHGEWTDLMESHFRLHCSAMHLLMDSLKDADDPDVRSALKKGMSFISRMHEKIDHGVWFYHDQLETDYTLMNKSPFMWHPSVALSKSPQNMLVLNTQLDSLVALERYANLSGERRFSVLVAWGYRATLHLLSRQPKKWLYNVLFSAIALTLYPTDSAKKFRVFTRIWKRLGWKFFIPVLPYIKTRYPRLTMPGGYIDRDLSVQTWAPDYLAVNLMDLVRASRGSYGEPLQVYIAQILDLCRRTDIGRRWGEEKNRCYALGFFAEALILIAVNQPTLVNDKMLADALLLCHKYKIGMPPSINSGNSEATVTFKSVPKSSCRDVVVANVTGDSKRASCIVVNLSSTPADLHTALFDVPTGWTIPDPILPVGGWQRLQKCVD